MHLAVPLRDSQSDAQTSTPSLVTVERESETGHSVRFSLLLYTPTLYLHHPCTTCFQLGRVEKRKLCSPDCKTSLDSAVVNVSLHSCYVCFLSLSPASHPFPPTVGRLTIQKKIITINHPSYVTSRSEGCCSAVFLHCQAPRRCRQSRA